MENDAVSISENRLTDGIAGGKNLVFKWKMLWQFDYNALPPPHQMLHQPSHKSDMKEFSPREQEVHKMDK